MAKVIEVEGPHAGREYTLNEATVFGRRLDTDIRVPLPTVSRRHAKITETSRGFVVADLKSGNGTIVNGRRINRTTLLKHGDQIQIGTALFVFRIEDVAELRALTDSTISFVESDPVAESTLLAAIEPDEVQPPKEETQHAPREPAIDAVQTTVPIDIGDSPPTALDLQQLLPEILSDLFRIFPIADRGLIMLLDRSGEALLPVAAKSRAESGEEQMIVSRTIVNKVQETHRSLLSADAMSDKRFGKRESIARLQVRSVMCVPLLRSGEFLGLIYIDTSRSESRFTPDDLNLLTGMAGQAALAIQNARTYDALLKQRRIEQELHFAQEVQKSFLPHELPEIPGFEFGAWYGAALEVGGDFYDFIRMPNGGLAIALGDVSGKGLPAALLMAKLMGDLRSFALSDGDPARVLTKLNRQIAKSRTPLGRFVTLLYILLDPASADVCVANAGHPPPLLRAGDSGALRRLDKVVSVPLGVIEDVDFHSETIRLGSGDSIAIFTDGVTEAMNGESEQFGTKRLETVVAESPSAPRAMMDNILLAINEFVGLASPSDDLTLVCFGRKQ
ncbi:MAG: SpoIIE family protein phosphatase [Planctomycetes bacterium]|nr:SpoIIE family protein phosphatase [Planctomycetota bacterium]